MDFCLPNLHFATIEFYQTVCSNFFLHQLTIHFLHGNSQTDRYRSSCKLPVMWLFQLAKNEANEKCSTGFVIVVLHDSLFSKRDSVVCVTGTYLHAFPF